MTSSFLDRLGDQLVASERDLVASSRARKRRRWLTPRSAGLLLAGLAIAVPAVAATHAWRPVLGRPQLHDTPAGTSATPVPSDARSVLAVLRRAQNSHDRSATARKLLRAVGQQFQGVRPASVRLVTPTPGHHALVLSAQGVGRVPGVGAPGQPDPVCLIFSGGGTCASGATVRATGIIMSAGPSVRGIVPDGVTRVMLTFAGGDTTSVTVRENVFWTTGTPTTSHAAPGPAGSGIRRTAPLETSATFTVRWLNATGKVVGPRPRR
jgi:hypothetical protein